ncbi:alpha/beta fold hydrolase [Spongiactinospora sp. TRM90649]|uniref:alpha/beta hydrolase n=1 Tax=Spongiactinospora sp. TRM90649 TaxID=3031114 RepID=UPI0023F8CF87|nr:alpha/beta fold hydrolase [Spongiactinospora sp. TRM90649]MDF5757118.1 alpha/beta fold hydrolase [Spongiactinospora sp. TRM90649]
MEHRIPRFTLDGVPGAEITVHPFATEDELGLKLTRFRRGDGDGDVVLLLHGLTSSSDIFIMPEIKNLATYLLDNGFGDVWTLDFRMSSHFPYDVETRRHTLDDIAHYDYPPALAEIRRKVGDRRIHVIAHCLGSVSFTMSLFGGAVGDIASLVCNSVALTPRVHRWSRAKLRFGATMFEYLLGLPYIDPRFSDAPPLTRRWLLARAVSALHPECREPACHMQSFMWGSGRPAMYAHHNLAPETHTHERLADLNGASGVHYYRHIDKMVRAGRAVKCDAADPRHAELPLDYLERAAEVTTPILFLTGDRNHVFTDSNIVCHRILEKAAPGRHELEILRGYGHIDPIIGKNAHVDVFPRMAAFIKRQAG